MIKIRGFFQKSSGDSQFLALAAGKPITLAADLKLHADLNHGFQNTLFNQQLNNLLVDRVLYLGIGGFQSAEEDIVEDGVGINVFRFPVKCKNFRGFGRNFFSEAGAGYEYPLLEAIRQSDHLMPAGNESEGQFQQLLLF